MFKKLIYTLIFFVCILASYFVTNSVFADDTNTFVFHNNIINEDVTVVRPSFLTNDFSYNFVIISKLSGSSGSYYNIGFCFSNVPLFIEYTPDEQYPFYFRCGDGIDNSSFYYLTLDSRYFSSNGYSKTLFDFSDRSESLFVNTSKSFSSSSFISSISNDIVYADFDVYDYDTNDLLFQVAPQEEALAGAVTSAVKLIDFSMVLQEVLEMLPTILLVLIGLIALMKAIKLLFSTFRNV